MNTGLLTDSGEASGKGRPISAESAESVDKHEHPQITQISQIRDQDGRNARSRPAAGGYAWAAHENGGGYDFIRRDRLARRRGSATRTWMIRTSA